ncbi:MAG: ADP-forming succinate--CoA ligase subunit beta [Deltaproteobacteria bacterium]|nr:ADP-forming succinate--CoA ligase subunit beta [Deltaproteobacteria bacterium]
MNIHEYQAKQLFKQYDIPTLHGKVVDSPTQAVTAAKELGTDAPWVVKAQIHAGGRGKGGGVKLAKSYDEVESYAKDIMSKPLVTHQTGPEGKQVHKLLIEEGCAIDKEFYLACVLDRATSSVVVMASTEGGVEIETVAEETPEKIFKVHVDPAVGFVPYQARTLAFGLGLEKDLHKPFTALIKNLIKLFLEKDCSLAEINPLVLTKDSSIIALDGKINFDGNALYRHPDIKELHDPTEEDARDLEAAKWGLNYVGLDGNIGCMVNGAGLAMATMDSIKAHGGEPANFLDVGGGASQEMVSKAFQLILSDSNVKGILVNIFGGIVKCDVLAQGILDGLKGIELHVPLVVRLEGTNVDKGREILEKSDIKVISAIGMKEAAEKAVAAAKGAL